MNTARLSETEAHRVMEQAAGELNLPVADPIRGGRAFDALLQSCPSKARDKR